MVMDILNICMTKGCVVQTIKDNYRLGDDIQSKVLAFAFGLSAEIERQLICQRTKEALARRRAQGVVLGRPKGGLTDIKKCKLFSRKTYILQQLDMGVSQRKLAEQCGVSRTTMAHFFGTSQVQMINEKRTINYGKFFIDIWKFKMFLILLL